MSLRKYKSVEQKNDVLNVMTKYKYRYRKYGSDKSLDALDHSISLEPVEDLLSYNHNNEFMEMDMMENSNKILIHALLDTLSKREKSVLEYYFGIDKDEALSLNEIGEEFDLSKSRIRQLKESAIMRLRNRHNNSTQQMKKQYIGHGEWYTLSSQYQKPSNSIPHVSRPYYPPKTLDSYVRVVTCGKGFSGKIPADVIEKYNKIKKSAADAIEKYNKLKKSKNNA
jgi:RNA polymerase sigma factor (sigma-70 family)